MKAIILAAGKATRLLPLTKDMPQSLLNVGNQTILDIQIETLLKAGINEIIIITGYQSEKIESYLKGTEAKVIFNPFYEVSGMALTLWVAREYIVGEVFVLYSDVLFDVGIIEGMNTHRENLCLAIKRNSNREEAEKILETNGIIREVNKNLKGATGEFIGIARFSAQSTKRLINELHQISRLNLYTPFIEVIDNLIDR